MTKSMRAWSSPGMVAAVSRKTFGPPGNCIRYARFFMMPAVFRHEPASRPAYRALISRKTPQIASRASASAIVETRSQAIRWRILGSHSRFAGAARPTTTTWLTKRIHTVSADASRHAPSGGTSGVSGNASLISAILRSWSSVTTIISEGLIANPLHLSYHRTGPAIDVCCGVRPHASAARVRCTSPLSRAPEPSSLNIDSARNRSRHAGETW